LVRSQSPDAQVQIERHYDSGAPEILADQAFCERVFVNLIQNAYQAMENTAHVPEGVLRISIAPESSGGRAGVSVVIEDTGPGVPPEMREQIFNPFVTSKKEGVGLGLAIVAKIVDDHRGWIRLESGSTSGASFRVFLPAAPDTGSQTTGTQYPTDEE